jgi:hypothetical protein
MELKKNEYRDHPSLSKLNQYYKGCLSGIEQTLFNVLQTDHVEWLHSYKDETGKTVYTNSWTNIPEEVKFKGITSNHYWKNSKDPSNPTPWGTDPDTFKL